MHVICKNSITEIKVVKTRFTHNALCMKYRLVIFALTTSTIEESATMPMEVWMYIIREVRPTIIYYLLFHDDSIPRLSENVDILYDVWWDKIKYSIIVSVINRIQESHKDVSVNSDY